MVWYGEEREGVDCGVVWGREEGVDCGVVWG